MIQKLTIQLGTYAAILLFTLALPWPAQAQIRIIPTDDNTRMAFLTEKTSTGFITAGTFTIDNPQENSINVDLFPVDGGRTSDGTFAIQPVTVSQTKMGQWTKLAQTTLAIEPQSKTSINFAISAPLNTNPGIYHGAIVATAKPKIKRGETKSPNPQTIILPIFIKVPGESTAEAEFNNFSHSTNNKQLYYNYQITNSGNTIIIAQPTLETKFFGLFSEQTSVAQKKLFPGDSIHFFTNFSNTPFPGVYTTNGQVIFSEYDILTDTITPLSAETKTLTINYKASIYLLIPIIILLLLVIQLFAKIRIKRLYLKGVPYTPLEGESLQAVAKKFNIRWKKLAKLNKLSKPYAISNTSTLIVPKNN